MTDPSQPERDLRCVELVDCLTAYLDGAVDEAQQRRIDTHLAGCGGCSAHSPRSPMIWPGSAAPDVGEGLPFGHSGVMWTA